METPFEKLEAEKKHGNIKLPTGIEPIEKRGGFDNLPTFKTPEEKEGFLKILEGAREVGNNKARFWNMLVSTVERTGYAPPEGRQAIVLDLACGNCEEGYVLNAFFGGGKFGWNSDNVKLIGIDIDRDSVQQATATYGKPDFSERITKYVLPSNYEFIVGDATNLDQHSQIPKDADIIVIRHQQISDNNQTWTKIFQQALKRINKDGIIVITSFSDIEHEELIRALQKINCEIVINEKNPFARLLGHKEVSLDRNIAIVKKKS